MPTALLTLNLIAEPGRRRATLDTAREIERCGFAGISVSSSFGNMTKSVGLALATERIPFATAIAPHRGRQPWAIGLQTTTRRGSLVTRRWRELDSNHRSPFGRHRVASFIKELLEEVTNRTGTRLLL